MPRMDVLHALASSERDAADVAAGLAVVCALLSNVAASPEEPKYRRVRKANPRIAPLLGREEEKLLRIAGFENSGDFLSCENTSSVAQTLEAAEIAKSALLRCCADGGVSRPRCAQAAQVLECALMDRAHEQSAESAQAEKRRRRAANAEAVRCPLRWRSAFAEAGGGYLCASGLLGTWLAAAEEHRVLAHDLLELQEAASRWYGEGARSYVESWRSRFVGASGPGDALEAGVSLDAAFKRELLRLREALFDFPATPGAVPALFRSSPTPGAHMQKKCAPEANIAEEAEEGGSDGECSILVSLPKSHTAVCELVE